MLDVDACGFRAASAEREPEHESLVTQENRGGVSLLLQLWPHAVAGERLACGQEHRKGLVGGRGHPDRVVDGKPLARPRMENARAPPLDVQERVPLPSPTTGERVTKTAPAVIFAQWAQAARAATGLCGPPTNFGTPIT